MTTTGDRPAAIPPSFIGLHITVADMAAAMDFYRRTGLSTPEGADETGHVELDLSNGTHLAFSTIAITRAYDPGWREPARPPGSVLQFQLTTRDAVDAMYQELTSAGYHGHLPPFDAFWGNRYAEIDDPDGNIVGFHSPTDPALRGVGPAT